MKLLPTSLFFAVSVVLLGLAGCPFPADPSPSEEIGPRIAGTWLGSYEFGEPETTRASFITTYFPDGSALTTSARAWGAGDPEKHGLSSLHHIQWEATGSHTIRWRLLHFGYEVDGSLRYLSRTHGTVEFDETFQKGTVAFQVEVHEPDSLLDPLDPNSPAAEPFFTASGKSEIRRLRVR
jgi:hypothetical protein